MGKKESIPTLHFQSVFCIGVFQTSKSSLPTSKFELPLLASANMAMHNAQAFTEARAPNAIFRLGCCFRTLDTCNSYISFLI
jgi:hypothetical protein